MKRTIPAVINAFGACCNQAPGIDRATMRNTFDWVWQNWKWSSTWGWDYPALAMCAARIGEPEHAVAQMRYCLSTRRENHYAINGHNFQRAPTVTPDLPLYLPEQ